MNSLRKNLLAGWGAAKANVIPALILQAVAAAILIAYYFWPLAAPWFEKLAVLKEQGGYLYSMISTATWAGVIPLLLQRWQKAEKREPLSRLPFFIVYWAFLGVVIDAFYRLQAVLFGNNAQPLTIFLKVCCDMFVFTPFLALPLSVTCYAWKDGGFRWQAVRDLLQSGWYAERVMPVLITCWMIWIPTVTVIYILPLSLQLPIQNLVECLWVLFLMILTDHSSVVEKLPENDLTHKEGSAAPQAANC